jgi:ATP-dependent RNA helicase SUPV3L1/SUV3
MLKPVPIRLRAGLWMIARNRETIPPLPAEGRTSMDLPRDADRDFYAVIGYLPLGDHAIRADMVERLAAMARQAVRESREAARRAQHERKPEPVASTSTTVAAPAADEISEWAIVAAAFGETEPARETASTAEPAPVVEESGPEETATAEPAPAAEEAPTPAEAAPEGPTPEEAKADEPKADEPKVDEPKADEPKVQEPRNDGPRPLPPGWFRAAPQMMSLVGCSEPEMANVLRGLGYRVHPPSDEHGSLYAFSMEPRFVREREEQRERQRQQQKQQRDQRRRERPERPNERQFFADTPRPERGQDRGKDERRRDVAGPEGPPNKGAREGRPEADRPRDDRRGPRPPRRDSGGPALRLYATTEKKSDAPAADSPFAKLLELKLGGKK